MGSPGVTFLATAIVLGTGAVWGFYWIPVRSLAAMGLGGAWGTVAITGAAALLLAPFALRDRQRIAATGALALASLALGGAAFALYSVAFLYGRVAIVILLFFLTPVWSTLIGRYLMGWHTPRLRVAAIVLGLVGLGVMLGAQGEAPVPRSTGEWMGLLSGICWSVATTGIRSRSQLGPVQAAFVFALGATLAAALLAPLLAPAPGLPSDAPATGGLAAALGTAFAAGALWWALSVGALMWATVRLEPARVGILLMSEVLVGAVSAAVIAGERLHAHEIAGGGLVLLAGVLEVWPLRRAVPPGRA